MLALTCLALAAAIASPMTTGKKRERVHMVYELYSWKANQKDEWQFSLLSGLTSQLKTPKEVFDPKKVGSGLHALDGKLAELPEGSDIVWIEAMLSLKRDPAIGRVEEGDPIAGMERLELPPKAIVDNVRTMAKKHKLHLEVGTRGGR